jgi:hypothetical protein
VPLMPMRTHCGTVVFCCTLVFENKLLKQTCMRMQTCTVLLRIVALVLRITPLLNFPQPALAFTAQLSEATRPMLHLADNGGAVRWDRGSLIQQVVSATALRVVDNRLRFLGRADSGEILTSHYDYATRCDRVADSLCLVQGDGLLPLGIGDGSRIFPVNGPVVVHGNMSSGCLDGNGRTVTSSDFSRYDVSACDSYDSVFDLLFLYNTTRGEFELRVAPVQFPQTLYGVVGFIVVVCIVVITQNLAIDLMQMESSKGVPVSTSTCMLLGIVLGVTSGLCPGWVRGSSNYFFHATVTQTDQLYAGILITYINIQLALAFAFEWVFQKDERRGKLHSVNFLLSVVLLALLSTHGTIETVLTPALFFVMLFRTTFKFIMLELNAPSPQLQSSNVMSSTQHATFPRDFYWHRTLEMLLIALDAVVIISTLNAGVLPINSTNIEALTSASMLFIVGVALGCGAGFHVKKRVK